MTRRGFVLWFTGLSGSGKSTLAAMAAAELRERGVHVETLDGDEIRKRLSRGLGFSRDDRDENIRRIGFAASLVARSGACAIAAAISPYRSVREEVRSSVARFVEIYTDCPVEVLAERDPKGLYKKALAGVIKNFTGVDDPYEAPGSPDVHLQTDRETPEQSLGKIMSKLEELGLIPGSRGGARITSSSAGTQLPHGQELVDRFVDESAARDAAASARTVIELDAGTYRDFLSIANGAFSPLRGFMTSKDYLRVVREMRLEQGLPWALPVTLAVNETTAAAVGEPSTVVLRAEGRAVGLLDVVESWRPDLEAEAVARFGTADRRDPRVARLFSRGPVYVGGEIRSLEPPRAAHRVVPSPRAVREELARDWRGPVTAVRTDTPPFSGEEYVLRAALELCGSALVFCGNSLVPSDVSVRCYEALAERYFPPHAYAALPYPWSTDELESRRLVTDAIVAKNFGASRLLVTARPGSNAEHAHVEHGELGIEVVVTAPAVRAHAIGIATAHTAPTGAAPLDPTTLLESVRCGSADPALVRPEVLAVLRAYFAR